MEVQLVVFGLAGEEFGVPISQVREINRLSAITSVPKAPPSVLGVINLRGRVIPVISLRERFGFDLGEASDANRIVVGEVSGQTVGFVVDAVTEVLRLDGQAIDAPPETASGVDSAFIEGIGKVGERLIIVLNLEKTFDMTEVAQLAG